MDYSGTPFPDLMLPWRFIWLPAASCTAIMNAVPHPCTMLKQLVQNGRSVLFHDVHCVEKYIEGYNAANWTLSIGNMSMSMLEHVLVLEV